MDERSRALFDAGHRVGGRLPIRHALLKKLSDGEPATTEDRDRHASSSGRIKSMTINGYYTSEIGLRQELGDERAAVPGRVPRVRSPRAPGVDADRIRISSIPIAHLKRTCRGRTALALQQRLPEVADASRCARRTLSSRKSSMRDALLDLLPGHGRRTVARGCGRTE